MEAKEYRDTEGNLREPTQNEVALDNAAADLAAALRTSFSWSDSGAVCQGCGRKFCLGCWATR